MFLSTCVLSMAVLVDFIGLFQSTFFGLFCQLLFLDTFRLGRIILGLVLLFFPCSFLVIFLYYYLTYSCIILG